VTLRVEKNSTLDAIAKHFRVTSPTVHQMVMTLERAGFIKKQPRAPRSIELLVDPKHLPELI
jgi:DNA-binding MarR family transcriptional regulator